MSTNYFWRTTPIETPAGPVVIDEMNPVVHIGKSSGGFTWAQDPSVVRRYCESHPEDPVIRDEYGREMTGREFLEYLDAIPAVSHRTEMIGEWFS